MAQRATSIGPKPSLFFLFFCVFVSPLRKPFLLFIFLCFPLFLFCLLLASPFFHFLFLSLSLSLSLSFLSFFLASCFSCHFLVLAFCYWFVCFLFEDVPLFCFSACCLVLNHNLRFVFALHLVLWLLFFVVFVAFIFSYFLIFWPTYQKTSLTKKRKFQKQQK